MTSRRRPFTLGEAAGIDSNTAEFARRHAHAIHRGNRKRSPAHSDTSDKENAVAAILEAGIDSSVSKASNALYQKSDGSGLAQTQRTGRDSEPFSARFDNAASSKTHKKNAGQKTVQGDVNVSQNHRVPLPPPIFIPAIAPSASRADTTDATTHLHNAQLIANFLDDDSDSESDASSIADADADMHLPPPPAADSDSEVSADVITESMLHEHAHALAPALDTPGGIDRKLEQRLKQIGYGKNTIGYFRYTRLVPRESRRKGDPQTPDKDFECSKRCWDGLVRAWRRRLHAWDPPLEELDIEVARMAESRGIHPAQEKALAKMKELYLEEVDWDGIPTMPWNPQTHDNGLSNPFDSNIEQLEHSFQDLNTEHKPHPVQGDLAESLAQVHIAPPAENTDTASK
ncbi:hypothetical protein M427DRAFT_29346 [Gonapodya prolifera JEL478]|uniref:Histone RNA hairpin-binding protein RNA-binding domain-containing protein n=1 Tax=Gonapodya prolifera (strain JEL478) TaxID=1344416 RepID=A0A139AQ76_GONPJ|nr:hypothetical protein M427DRAFT_29346 [Gonapodya prolifera JEL478]|eukprot:KXS18886.1 hypothetical protein M427DRAFT_29346 [Gonapodya prolifera JEL478]